MSLKKFYSACSSSDYTGRVLMLRNKTLEVRVENVSVQKNPDTE
jgi:hypothetical protein